MPTAALRLLVSKKCALIASLSLRTKSTNKTPKERICKHSSKAESTSFWRINKSHKQEKQALEAKISDLKSKQGVGITQDEISDLKANYEAKKIGMGYKAIVSVLELRGLMWQEFLSLAY